MDLVLWNEQVEKENKKEGYESVLERFLWKADPNEKFHVDIQYNQMHLLGLLVCRMCVASDLEQMSSKRLQLMEVHPREMSLKQVKDTLANLQFEWPVFINKIKDDVAKVQGVQEYLESVMERVGVLVGHAHSETVLNDVQDSEWAGCDKLRKLTPSAIRRLLASVLVLYRHMDLFFMSEEVALADKDKEYKVGVSAYHHEASTESFHKMCMHFFLPAGAKMHYKHDFPGMYNDVSQAVYFHDSGYKRINREDYTSTSPIHMLPSVCLLYPEVPVKYEDDDFDPSVDQGWYWVLVPRRIYLVSPEPRVYYSEDLAALVHLYVSSVH